jgi:hypothetical protein
MAQEPSLSEITSVAVDAERGTGTPAVVFETKSLVDTLSKAAQYKAASDWEKYKRFQDGLGDLFKNLSDTQSLETMAEDKPMLQQEAAQILDEISKNPRALFGAKQAEVMGKLGGLRAKAVQSKQDKLFLDANNKYIADNEELNNEDNKALLEGFTKAGLGQRKPFTLQLPEIFDATKFFGELNKPEKLGESFVTPDNQFIVEREKELRRFQPYMDKVKAAIQGVTDKQGRPKMKALQRIYDTLPASVKQAYEQNGGVGKFLEDMAVNYFGGTEDIETVVKEERKANPGYLEKEKLAQKAANDKANRAIEWAKLDWEKEKKRLEGKPTEDAQFFLENFTNSIIDKAKGSGKKTFVTGTDTPQYELPLSNATLEAFAFTSFDEKNQKTVKVMPDRAVVDDNGNFEFKFYKRDGDKIKYKNGNPIIDEQKTKSVTRDEFKGVVGNVLLGKKATAVELQEDQSEDEAPSWAE